MGTYIQFFTRRNAGRNVYMMSTDTTDHLRWSASYESSDALHCAYHTETFLLNLILLSNISLGTMVTFKKKHNHYKLLLHVLLQRCLPGWTSLKEFYNQ